MRYGAFFIYFITIGALAQAPQVPHKLRFAGMTLTIRDDARREIQKDVDALTQSPRYFNIKVERARTYFPVIEKIFEEERLPDEFKYLVLQESALIPDAVSVSKAVGFWQFKDFTALEMGLRVDKEIDERMNIVSSTRAAARYLKKNNYFFNNWLYALQAYQMGAGGVMDAVKDTKSGATHMEITGKTYWYVKKFLAHMVAFEPAVKGQGATQLAFYENKEKQSVKDLAKTVEMDEEQLRSYNKWIKNGVIPGDRAYAVALPVPTGARLASSLPLSGLGVNNGTKASVGSLNTIKHDRVRVNGVWAIRATAGESMTALAARAGVDLSDFLKYNEVSINHKPTPDQHYFESRKRARAQQAYHKVQPGETLWMISQRYGVRMKKLRRFNRFKSEADLKPGMTLWLSSMRPKNNQQAPPPDEIIELDQSEVFSWTASPVEVVATTEPTTQQISTAPVPQVEEKEQDTLKISKQADDVILPDTLKESKADSSKTAVITVIPEQHVVQPGETLYGIARKYDLAVMDIVAWNELNLQTPLKPGQTLKLQGKRDDSEVKAPTAAEIIHEVKASDTLYSVARQYGVTIKELMDWNNKKDFTVSVGEKLKIVQK